MSTRFTLRGHLLGTTYRRYDKYMVLFGVTLIALSSYDDQHNSSRTFSGTLLVQERIAL